MARVELGAAFYVDVRHQLEWLAGLEEWGRIERLLENLVDLTDRIATFPGLGREVAREQGRTMRRISVGRLPFYVWYRFDPRGGGTIRISRLFHAHQRAPSPRAHADD